MKITFFRCRHCGNIAILIYDSGAPLSCCGEIMQELIPQNNEYQGNEKHIPMITTDNNHVSIRIGSVPHPMDAGHFIEWVIIQTSDGFQEKKLLPGMKPEIDFVLHDAEILECVYTYCNLHGLWNACTN